MTKYAKIQLNGKKPQKPGGFAVDYIKTYRRRSKTPALDDIIEQFVGVRRSTILAIRDESDEPEYGQLAFSTYDMEERWKLWQVGHSRSAWMERSLVFSAMFLDYRSVKFGQQAKDPKCGFRFLQQLNEDEITHDDHYRLLTSVELEQAAFANVFSAHWQGYLTQLLIRPPGDSPPSNELFPDAYTRPNWRVARILAGLSYCRPIGAFFSLGVQTTSWLKAGGRETCRKRTVCPHCHARYATRLVHRVEEGPWRKSRRRGKRLVFLRTAISTQDLEALNYDENASFDSDRDDEAREIRARYQIRTTDSPRFREDHRELPGDASTIGKINYNQSLSDSLTRCEVSAAADQLKGLVEWCTAHGITGGLQFHSIGPRGRNFLHELSVVGEIDAGHVASLIDTLCDTCSPPMLNGRNIEGIVFAEGYVDAARLAIAGSSWKFDLNEVGAIFNEFAEEKCFYEHRPKGVRGALAWQPLFLMSSVAFWSRYHVLQEMRFKSYRAFGNWTSLLVPDRQHKSVVQKERARQKSMELTNSPATRLQVRLQRMLEGKRFTQSELSKAADVSTAAVSRFLSEQYGSAKLIQKLTLAIERLNEAKRREPIAEPPKPTPITTADVTATLLEYRKNQRWLAMQLECSPSKVSRRLSRDGSLTDDFGERVALVLDNLKEQHQSNLDHTSTHAVHQNVVVQSVHEVIN